jgi:molecular chaperone DnaJ
MNDEYYRVLGVQPGASKEEIKRAYKAKAAQSHPDNKDTGNQEEFLKVQEAYDILSGKSQPKKARPPPNPNPGTYQKIKFDWDFDPFSGVDWDGYFNKYNSKKVYENFFQQEDKPPVEDSHVRVTIQSNVQEVKDGKVFRVRYKKAEGCKSCNGVGGTSKATCSQCNGATVVESRHFYNGVPVYMTQTCSTCKGTGSVIVNACNTCQSKGYVEKEEKLAFKFEVVETE